MTFQLSIVVPCYNEEEVLPETNSRLLTVLARLHETGVITADSAVYYVDDGSRDGTWRCIEEMARADSRVHGFKLSRNQGHQAALLAGLLSAPGDAIISIDADLQDDVAVIQDMAKAFVNGADVVYGVRDSRSTDSPFKRNTALAYYSLMKRMGVDLVRNHADYRLLSRRAIESLRQYDEVNVFLRGVVPLLGYQSASVRYDRAERFAGVSKYPLKKMLSFAIEGVTSFSVVPLRLITFLGFLVCALSFVMIIYVLYGTLVRDALLPGWASSVIPIYFLGGVQIMAIGVLGEYIGKIYMESKRRPKYFVESRV
jgi:glycosyltransferase involved in cell wall biosynthesis